MINTDDNLLIPFDNRVFTLPDGTKRTFTAQEWANMSVLLSHSSVKCLYENNIHIMKTIDGLVLTNHDTQELLSEVNNLIAHHCIKLYQGFDETFGTEYWIDTDLYSGNVSVKKREANINRVI